MGGLCFYAPVETGPGDTNLTSRLLADQTKS